MHMPQSKRGKKGKGRYDAGRKTERKKDAGWKEGPMKPFGSGWVLALHFSGRVKWLLVVLFHFRMENGVMIRFVQFWAAF